MTTKRFLFWEWHVHDWGKWERVNIQIPVTDMLGNILRVDKVTGQHRTCKDCGYEEVERLIDAEEA